MSRVVMFIAGEEVASSCVKIGTAEECRDAALRLNQSSERHKTVQWRVLPAL